MGILRKTVIYLLLIVVIISCASEEVKGPEAASRTEESTPSKPELPPVEIVNIPPPKGKTYKNSLGVEFVQIPAGEFQMGCSKGDTECEDNEKPLHLVKITKSFYMGKFEVTQGQWTKLMGSNPSSFKECGENCPVENVSWNDAHEFIERLCTREKYSPCKHRLPTEAEWEYAARAGTKTKYYWGIFPNDDYFWYDENSGRSTNPVGKKKPNAWGLYDISGNVWEWVEDWYDERYYSKSPDINGPSSGGNRILRGGSWDYYARSSRLSYRINYDPDIRFRNYGFRLVLLP